MRMTNSSRWVLTGFLLTFLYFPSLGGNITSHSPSDYTPPALDVNASILTQDCDTGVATICYSVDGGTEPYVASCQDQNSTLYAANGSCFENLPPGTYTISVADSGADNGSTTVIVPQPLTVLVNSTTSTSCFGSCDGAAELSVSGGEGDVNFLVEGVVFTYPDDFNTLCAGSYSAIAVDENTCSFEFNFLIAEPQEIIASIATGNVTCTGMNDGQVILATNGGTPPLVTEYADSNLDFENMEVGSYAFTVTDSEGCFINDTIHVEADIESDFSLKIFTTPVSCWNANDGTATALVTGGQEPITIQWNDPLEQTTEIALGLTNRQYIVEVEDANGCFYSERVDIDLTVGCLFIADALTPNSDGYNDTWVIGGLEFFPEALVQVYNRWGQLVFESKGYNLPWTGTYLGNKLPVADYYYIITNGGTENAIQGTVTIKY